jgi:hypothetical protein
MGASAEEEFLARVDSIVGGRCTHTRITSGAENPPIFSLQYANRPEIGWTTSLTVGLSSVPNVDWRADAGPELAIRMRSADPAWGLAIGELARQSRSRRPILPELPIGFGAQIAAGSSLCAFLLVEARSFPRKPLHCAGRHILLVEALPLHRDELERIRDDDDFEWLLSLEVDFADPSRPSCADAG